MQFFHICNVADIIVVVANGGKISDCPKFGNFLVTYDYIFLCCAQFKVLFCAALKSMVPHV